MKYILPLTDNLKQAAMTGKYDFTLPDDVEILCVTIVEFLRIEDWDEITFGVWDHTLCALKNYSLSKESIIDVFNNLDMNVFYQDWSSAEGYENYVNTFDLLSISFAQKWNIMYPEYKFIVPAYPYVVIVETNEIMNKSDCDLFFGIPIDSSTRLALMK